MEIITGVERRRRWSPEDKVRIVAETLVPGASIADVARRHKLSRSLIFDWRRQAMGGRGCAPQREAAAAPLQLLPVSLVPEDGPAAPPSAPPPGGGWADAGLAEVVLRNGRVLRVPLGADGRAVARLAAALEA